MKFTDHKLRTWLAGSFGLLVLMSILSGGLAISKMASIEANLDDVVNVNNVKTALNNEMSEAVHIVARVIRTMALLEDRTAKEREQAKIVKARADYDLAWTNLQKFTPGPSAKAVRDRIEAAASASRAVNDKVVALALEGNAAGATALLLSEPARAMDQWQLAIDDNLVIQKAQSAQEYVEAHADYNLARMLVVGLSATSTLLALLLGWFITRGVVRSLGAEPVEAAALAQSISEGDLSADIALKPGDTSSMMAQMKTMQDSLAKVVNDVRQNAEGVATASAQIAQGNLDLSQRTEEQASALEQTAASMEQLGSTVKQNADNARQANQLAQGASAVAVRGGDVVGKVVDTMKAINDSSKRIADIISVIDGIAFQTNASVERVEQGSALVDQAGITMTEVVTSIRRVTDIMGEISAASSEQSAGVSQVGEAVSQMDQVTQQNAALVEESAAAAESLKLQAHQLVATVAVFKLAGSTPSFQPVTRARTAPAAVERRGPARATNVKRPVFGRTRLAPNTAPKAVTPVDSPDATQRTGTDAWESF